MTSTPSASALSAVLRCQRNILARKQANKKRTPASVYGHGVTTSGDSVKSYFRPLWGFIFHGERVEIPGVLSMTARLQTKSCKSKDHLVKNTLKTENKVSTACQCSKTKQMSDCNVLSKNSLVLRRDSAYLQKNFSYLRSCLICVVYTQRFNHINLNTLFPHGLLHFLRDKLLYFTTAVSDSVRTQLDLNQLHPDCDNSSRCARCSSKHLEDQPETAKPGS